MTSTLQIGDRRELFVDHTLIERMEHCSLKLHEPISGGIAVARDRPWEGLCNMGSSVIYHDGHYILYYQSLALDDEQGGLCAAESIDGITWTKPALGIVGQDTNIVGSAEGIAVLPYYNSAPWIDTRPGVPADERIKATTTEPLSGERHTNYNDPPGPKRLVVWTSSDGFTFRKLTPQPEIVSDLKNCFDGGNSLFWSEAEQQYVCYYRFYDAEWGVGRRTMARITSRDFLHWTEPEPMTYGGAPREQFYINNTIPYFRAPHLSVAVAARFMEGRQVLSDEEALHIGLRELRGYNYHHDCSDGVLLTSRAGSTQYDRTFLEGFVRPGPGAPNWTSRTNFPLTGILPCGPDRMMMFVTRHYMQDTFHIERLLLRLDGFASVNAPWAGGDLITKSFLFAGSKLEINYRTSAAGSVRVEIQDAQGVPLPSYGLEDCTEIIGDEISRTVSWHSGADVSRLAGQPVRLRFAMKDADLFSLRFSQ